MPNRDKLRIDEIMMLLCPIYIPVMVYYFGGLMATIIFYAGCAIALYYVLFILTMVVCGLYEWIKTIVQKLKTKNGSENNVFN